MIVTETISKVVGAIASIDSAQLIKGSLVLAFAALLAGAIGYCLGCAPLLYVAGAVPIALIMGNGLIFLIKRYALPEDLCELLGTLEKIRHSQADQSEIDLSKLELYRARLPTRYDYIVGRRLPAGSAYELVERNLKADEAQPVPKDRILDSSGQDDLYEDMRKDVDRNFVVRVSQHGKTDTHLLSSAADLTLGTCASQCQAGDPSPLDKLRTAVEAANGGWNLVEAVIDDTHQGVLAILVPFKHLWTTLQSDFGCAASYDDKSLECQILDLAIENNGLVRRSVSGKIQYAGTMLSVDQEQSLYMLGDQIHEQTDSLSLRRINPYFYGWTESVHQLADNDLLPHIEDADKQALQAQWHKQQAINEAYDYLFAKSLDPETLKQQIIKLEGCCETDLQRALHWRALEAVSPETMHRVKNFVEGIELLCQENVKIDDLLNEAIPGSEWDIIRAQCKLSFIEGKSITDEVATQLTNGMQPSCQSKAVKDYLQELLNYYVRLNKYKQRRDSIQSAIETWDQV